MSCEVKAFGKVTDLSTVQELLGFSQEESWLYSVYHSISPTGELIAFGHGSKLILLSTQWTDSNETPTYTITWKGELENPNEIITSILCLPLYGSGVSSGADWTCITVGLASGLVLFYSDSGVQIFSQRWHEEPVQSIKAQFVNKCREEIHLGYLSCVCIIQGSQLFPVLRGLKQRLSKNRITSAVGKKTNVSQFPDTVPCRKWEYRNRPGTVNDVAVVGQPNLSTFDHLLDHSLEKGFYAKPRSAPLQQSLVLGVGVKPFVGFYYAKEGYIPADLTFVAKAVANKVMSSLPNWLFKSSNSSQPAQEEQIQQIPQGEPMSCRFGICDIQRQGFNIWLAPGNNLAAVVDNLSRVVLIDCNRGIVLRIWKGYREAQCAFIKAKEKTLKTDKSEKRKALFLVIFAPRRSSLEIWALQHGPKVAAFNVSKNGQLIYNTYGLLGINPNANVKFSTKRCIFIDPTDELLKEIIIPFHCSLSNEDSKTSKDVHLLRRIKLHLRGGDCGSSVSEETIITNCGELQTNEIRWQCCQYLAGNKRVKPELFKSAILAIKKSIQQDGVLECSPDFKSLLLLIENYLKLTDFYMYMIAASEAGTTATVDKFDDDQNPNPNQNEKDSVKLCLTENDLETIQNLLDLKKAESDAQRNNKVTFKEKHTENDFIDYLSIFSIDSPEIHLNPQKSSNFGFIGQMLFKRFLKKGHNLQLFTESARKSCISSEDIMSLILYYWLEKTFNYKRSEEVIEDMTRLALIVQNICDLADSKIEYEYNEICSWWQKVRELILESPCALRGLLASIVCRNVSLLMQKRESSDDNSEEDNWEKVSQEAAQWSLLIGKLDDISVLGAILSYSEQAKNPKFPILQYKKPDCSLKAIFLGGKGIIVEYVAKWIANFGIHPSNLIEKVKEAKEEENPTLKEKSTLNEENQEENNQENAGNDIIEEEYNIVLEHLEHLREHFPFSLESGILLCQLAWEFMCHWSKHLPNLEYLRAGLTCLETFRPEDYALKHGLCCMIWNAHLKIPLEATKKLMHKAGRLPTEKLCQQDIGLSVSTVSDFLECCLEFFKEFSSSLNYEKKELRFEEILVEGQIPLAQLTLQQNKALKEMLDLHIQLCKVLHLIAFFSLKISKPITFLFDGMSNQTFFMEFNRELPYTLPPADLILKKHREEFLCQAVTASMDLIREDLERLYVLEHTAYMNQIEELADMWELNKEIVKKHQVVEMYAHGWDAYAEELLEEIIDIEEIGPLLLEIAGRRLNLYTSKSRSAFMQVASIGPLVLNYLDNLKSETNGIQITGEAEDIDLERLCMLAAKAFECMAERGQETRQLRIAGQLYDACCMLKARAQLGHLSDDDD